MDTALASTVVDTISAGVVVHDADTGMIRDVNDAFTEIHGYDRDELVGHAIEIVSPDTPEYSLDQATSRIQQARDEGSIRFEWRNKRADGTTFPVEVRLTPLSLDEGEYVIATVRDISDRKEYERELEQSEAKYRSLFEDARDAIMLLDEDGFFDCNEMTLELFGFDSVEAFAEYTPGELSPETQPDGTDSQEAAQTHIETAKEEGEAFFEWVHTRKDGTEFYADVKLNSLQLDGDPVLRALVRDITERKEYEREIENREAKYRSLFEDTRDPVILLNEKGFIDCNEMALELFGFDSVEAFTEYTPWELSPQTQPDGTDSQEAAEDRIETAFEEGEAFFEWIHTRSDGTEFPAEVKLSRFELDGEPVLHELVRDITERKEYERKLEEQRDNLEVLNQVLRHDVRNDLQLVTAYASLHRDTCETEEAKDHITTIAESAEHAVELTETAREMADVMLSDSAETERINLKTTLENEVSEVQSSYPESAITYGTPIPSVRITATEMLSSVFSNLLKNAIQHNDKDVAEVTISATEQDETVTVRIADNGPGIPDDQKETIFGKGERGLDSSGTGMGLYLVETLVTSYNGEVWVEDNDPDGSVFVVELPLPE